MTIKKTTRFVTIAALFLVPIFALIVANSLFFPFITGKAFYFRLMVEIAFAAWVILAFLDARYRPKLNALTVGVTLFTVVALIADLLGVNPIRSMWSNFERMEGWITIVHLWAFFIAAAAVFGAEGEAKKWWHRFFNFELAVAFVVGLYGLGQLLGWFAIHQGSTRIDASLGNAAYMAVYMLMNAGLAAYLFLAEKAKRAAAKSPGISFMGWIYIVLTVLFSFLLFETSTRGTILGFTGGLMLALFLYALFAKNGSKRSRMISGGVVALIVIAGIGIYALRNQPIVKNNEVLNRMTSISLSNTESTARLYIWQMALTGWTERPVLGWGQENFNYIFNANYNPKMWSQEQWFDRAHSVYFDWLVAGGLVGLMAYLALYVLLLRGIWKSGFTMSEKCALTGLVAGYAVHNIFVFDNLASYVLFFTLLGFVASIKSSAALRHPLLQRGNSSQESFTNGASTIGGTKEVRPEIVEYVVAPISIVALVIVIFFFELRPYQANTALITALQSCSGPTPDATLFDKALAVNTYVANQEIREQSLSCAGSVIGSQSAPGPTKQAFFQLAVNNIQAQIAATPKDARMYVLGGGFLLGAGQNAQALQLLVDAHALSPAKQSIDFQLAQAYLNAGQIPESVAVLRQAYEGDPSYGEARSAYATGLVLTGQESLAHQLFGDDPAVFQTEQMAGVYANLKQYQKAISIYVALIKNSPTDVNLLSRLAQIQYAAGMKTQAIATLRSIEKDHPEYKDQIEAAIKQVQ
ncbi:O-antigen ligase family protein [Patescibacteria group bacterium]|nr:O-antigen ligase family protein [Patescibacteria group bacterium]MDE1946818.1 O-antigen ligase family protein [Patescibacteria group bacterium]MDE2011156.1 O-antigen ligase family protein [Patescibacteria group bacterium]MDE2233065.1 O-antigen ligase family protein [Patescibacteria group bacterium]